MQAAKGQGNSSSPINYGGGLRWGVNVEEVRERRCEGLKVLKQSHLLLCVN